MREITGSSAHCQSVQRIGEAEAAGLTPYMVFVYRPFESAARAAVMRLLEIGRPVGLDQLGPAHYDAQRTFFQLYQAFGSRINFDVILNEGGIDEISGRTSNLCRIHTLPGLNRCDHCPDDRGFDAAPFTVTVVPMEHQ